MGFWDGLLLVNSNDVHNEFNYVEVSYGGGTTDTFFGDVSNLTISDRTGACSAKITNSSFTNSKGQGLSIRTNGVLTGFSNNSFMNNTLYPVRLPANQVGILDENSKFSLNNGINAIGIIGFLKNTKETTWGPFKDGTKYRFIELFYTDSGLVILPGSVFEVASQKALGVGGNGYIIAKGTADKHIVFTGEVKTAGSWGGILIDNSKDVRNELSYTDISYGGGDPAYGYAARGNLILFSGFGMNGRIKVSNCNVNNSSEYGIAQFIGTLVLDSPDSNTYSNNAKGNIGK